ncbi:hypothetical protein QL285_027983 [Trifolium repens]|nr:hypothetical protein QL285_027983 [Trifolium repens]
MDSPRTPISSSTRLLSTPISSSTISPTPISPRTPLSRIPISSSPTVTPSPPPPPPRAYKSTNNQQIAYSTEMLKFMDKVIHTYQLLLIEFRRNENTAEAIEAERKRKIRILMSLR